VVGQTKRPVLVGTVRTITNPRSLSARSYEFTSSHTDGTTHVGTWPKAGETRIIDGDTFEYELRPGPGVIRLRFLPPAES
jgi:endonuclease YncB( thermonuclease family)